MSESDENRSGDLEHISTQWSQLGDANVFVLRYTSAIENYLRRILTTDDEVQEVLQAFLVRVLERGFEHADPDKGRFRHYLSRSVRNAARTYQRSRSRSKSHQSICEEPSESSEPLDAIWQKEWHECIMNRAMQRLRHREQTSDGNLGHSALQLHLASPSEDSRALANQLSEKVGREVSSAVFRKQLSRARKSLAEFLVQEVAETVDSTSKDDLRNELREVGLWRYVADYVT